jgi:hypothetical protein
VELPANAIAFVSQVRAGHGVKISRADFHHALIQAAVQKGRRSAPKPGGNGYGKLKKIAIGELLGVVWIQGQAAEMGIGTTRRQVARELARLKKQAFKDLADYHRFLKEAHYTRRDVHERVEIQILSTRIQERIVTGVNGKVAQQKAFARFLAEYSKRWKSRTVCAPGYVIASCSNAPPRDGASIRSLSPVRQRAPS